MGILGLWSSASYIPSLSCCRYVCDAGLLGMYPLSSNFVPPGSKEPEGTRRHRLTRPYAGPLIAAGTLNGTLTHATDTHAGSLVEHVSFVRSLHQQQKRGADPSWLNYAERDAFRAMAEAHFLLPPSQVI